VADRLATQDLDSLPDTALTQEALALRQLLADRLEGQWLRRLAAVDGRGAAGADHGIPAPSTASWLRHRLPMGANAASSGVRTARALVRGPLPATAQARGRLAADPRPRRPAHRHPTPPTTPRRRLTRWPLPSAHRDAEPAEVLPVQGLMPPGLTSQAMRPRPPCQARRWAPKQPNPTVPGK
jgi:hypothetical protein